MEEQFEKKFPNGAVSFYIKLYCRKKGETKKKCRAMQEAMRSWISLKKSEKQLIETKYHEYKSNFKKNIALYLKNAEPYLQSKVKILDRSSQIAINEEIDKDLSSSKSEVNENENQTHTLNEENTENHYQDENTLNISITPTMINTISEGDEIISIPEPTAPKIMTSKELFLIIKEKENNALVWEELTLVQRRRYREAVLTIKKNYLGQYRKYLEHLPSDKLFKHYRTIVNNSV